MSNSSYFRRRPIGRAASPPTWACYEQITYQDDSDDSCSEDDEDYERPSSDDDDMAVTGKMDIDSSEEKAPDAPADVKGKGKERATEADDKAREAIALKAREREIRRQQERERRERRRERQATLRPILTIQRSQGFVWNQDLFVPSYIKDRYIASTSPPSHDSRLLSKGHDNYEVEVVEIRVDGHGLAGILP
ncbi:hypothetical protein CYLTODRAFT_421248 [Cylindrobasidium torrendii FP15055 ss-10]|uniref:Uncharacterized protein n=1 Tax=Cylindrobasidium torrendii FP15055 ss-10 TaxID=1314674 RepID=A0A0D7BEE1_9AGAR|nr:hypothetical protein CYLTODRAFT_421248 [Cylindrobasidium torrendii FP15055 ss-10]